ncbi:MAG: response regulator [Chloroflexota bacterium]
MDAPELPAAPEEQRILIVEDNPVNQLVAARLVARLGYQWDHAANGREAVQAVARREYTLILMDCEMPEMDGWEATRQIRRAEARGPHVPIVAVTASTRRDNRERCLRAGMDDYLVKPLRESILRAVLARWIGAPYPR